MKRFSILFALPLALTAASAFAQTATVYAVHGIPGTALGGATTDLPVDVAINGGCVPALNGFNFGEIRGPLSLPAPGSYTIDIKPANAITPCSEATLLSKMVDVVPGINASVVAHLDAAGSPLISVFVNDTSRTAPGQGRFILHHTAKAPAVDVSVTRGHGAGRRPSVNIPGFSNGNQVAAEFRPGNWNASLSVGDSVVFGPATLNLQPKTAQLVYAIGEFPSTFTVVTKTITTAR